MHISLRRLFNISLTRHRLSGTVLITDIPFQYNSTFSTILEKSNILSIRWNQHWWFQLLTELGISLRKEYSINFVWRWWESYSSCLQYKYRILPLLRFIAFISNRINDFVDLNMNVYLAQFCRTLINIWRFISFHISNRTVNLNWIWHKY